MTVTSVLSQIWLLGLMRECGYGRERVQGVKVGRRRGTPVAWGLQISRTTRTTVHVYLDKQLFLVGCYLGSFLRPVGAVRGTVES